MNRDEPFLGGKGLLLPGLARCAAHLPFSDNLFILQTRLTKTKTQQQRAEFVHYNMPRRTAHTAHRALSAHSLIQAKVYEVFMLKFHSTCYSTSA